MKGKLLNKDEISKLKYGTLVWMEIDENKGVYSVTEGEQLCIKGGIIVEKIKEKIFVPLDFKSMLLHQNDIKNALVYEWIKEKKSEPKFYYGDEILKMIKEGKLTKDDVIITQDNKQISLDEMMIMDIFKFVNLKYTIKKRKNYVTFDEAVKTGKKFRLKRRKEFLTDLGNIRLLVNLYSVQYNSHFRSSTLLSQYMRKIMDDKVWEVEN